MKLFVPACGDRLVLTSDWTFPLYLESRNMKFADASGFLKPDEAKRWGVWEGESYRSGYKKIDVTLPAGTTLECDRIYIRTFNKSAKTVEDDFDSITWKIVNKKKNQRFWAKLSDCNRIEFDLPGDANFKERATAEAIENAKKPVKINADTIRDWLQNMRWSASSLTPLHAFTKSLDDEILAHFESSEALYKKVHEEGKKKREEYDRQAGGRFYHGWGHAAQPMKPLDKTEFIKRFWTDTNMCKFSKRSDGTLSRRFTHNNAYGNGYYGAEMRDALQGLSFNVITDASDQNVVGVEVNKTREAPNNETE